MVDIFDKKTRSRMMAGIRAKNTKPELLIRQGLHRLGFRYRLHAANLPGKPDLVFRKYHAVILVHGCFWHAHSCPLFKWPGTRQAFWREKISANRERDQRQLQQLSSRGWKVLTIWECALKGRGRRNLREVIHTTANWLQFDEQNAEILGK